MKWMTVKHCIIACVRSGGARAQSRDQPVEVYSPGGGAIPGGNDIRWSANPWLALHSHSLPYLRPLQGHRTAPLLLHPSTAICYRDDIPWHQQPKI